MTFNQACSGGWMGSLIATKRSRSRAGIFLRPCREAHAGLGLAAVSCRWPGTWLRPSGRLKWTPIGRQDVGRGLLRRRRIRHQGCIHVSPAPGIRRRTAVMGGTAPPYGQVHICRNCNGRRTGLHIGNCA
jgi:hypothetical protein